MLCKDFESNLDAFLDQTLSAAESAAMRKHIKQCPTCAQAYEHMEAMLASLGEMGQVKAPENFTRLVMDKIKAQPRKRRFTTPAKIASGVAACLVVGVLAVALIGGGVLNGANRMMAPMSAASTSYAGNEESALKFQVAADADYGYKSAGGVSYAAQSPAASAVPAPSEAGRDYAAADTMNQTAESAQAAQYERKIIKDGNLTLETSSYDEATERIADIITASGGYMQTSSSSGKPISETGYDYGRYASFTAKIPYQQFDQVVGQLKQCGSVEYSSESSQDITSDYYDTKTRLDSYKLQYQKIEALLDRAQTLEDIITIQSKLTELQYQIDSLEGQLKMWDQLVAFSTVYISVNEVADKTQVKNVDPTLGERIREGFVKAINSFVAGVENFIVWISSSFIGILFFAAVVIAVWLIIRAAVRRRRRRMDAK